MTDLFDQKPTIERKSNAWQSLDWRTIKKQKQRMLWVLLNHSLLRYDEIPHWYQHYYGEKIKESSVCGRLNELATLGYVNTENEKLNCTGEMMVTAYTVTQKGIDYLVKKV